MWKKIEDYRHKATLMKRPVSSPNKAESPLTHILINKEWNCRKSINSCLPPYYDILELAMNGETRRDNHFTQQLQ